MLNFMPSTKRRALMRPHYRTCLNVLYTLMVKKVKMKNEELTIVEAN